MSDVNLPEGWALSRLSGTIAIDGLISDGDWIESKDQDPNGSVRLIQLADIGDGDFRNKSERFMTPESANALSCTFLKSGDVLIARMPDPLGRACIFPGVGLEAVTVVDICLIRTGEKSAISNKLLISWINSPAIRNLIAANASGTTRKRITRKKLEVFELPIPPLAEQKVIADKLDTLLAQVETTKAHLERIPEILKTFRQSVLAAAVSGKLTEGWRRKNGSRVSESERLEEIRQYKYQFWLTEQKAKFEAKGKRPNNDDWKKKYKEAEIDPEFHKRELPEDWVFQPLDGLVYIAARIGWKGLKASEYTESGPLFLSVHSLNYGREVKLSEAFHISQERYDESPEIMLQNDDILLCKDGAGIGKIGIVKNLREPASINSSLLLIRSGRFFVPEFLYFFLAGPTMQRLVQERMTGSAVPHLFQRDVKEFVLEVPPLKEQTEIVRRVEELFAFADSIEQKVNAALERVNNLTQSILAKAFRGELTADWRAANPDLIIGDNSAEALLAKIKAEREAIKKQPRPKRTAVKKNKGSRMSKEIIKVVEALKQAGKPLSGQQLLAAAGYPSDSSTDQLEQFFLDIREALATEKSIVKLERKDDGQDWFALAEAATNE
ncbi:restriction endonuclease subunit S [Neptunomonas phycophila]|uniref:restriction endonuclease subunit S n=1 Tax=Neptunomonas phycophila TaxID=1572645 RepID=UPI0037355705